MPFRITDKMIHQKYLKYIALVVSLISIFFSIKFYIPTHDSLGMPIVSSQEDIYPSRIFLIIGYVGLILFIVLLVKDIKNYRKKLTNH